MQQKADAFEYRMQPVVLIVPKGSAQTAVELRQKDAETLRARIETCDQANQYFKSMPNAAIRDTVIKTSADIPATLRKVLDETPIGHLTPPEVTKQGIEMVALCARKPTTIDTPKTQGNARQDVSRRNTRRRRTTYLQRDPQGCDDRISSGWRRRLEREFGRIEGAATSRLRSSRNRRNMTFQMTFRSS